MIKLCFILGHRLGIWANPENKCIDCGKVLRSTHIDLDGSHLTCREMAGRINGPKE